MAYFLFQLQKFTLLKNLKKKKTNFDPYVHWLEIDMDLIKVKTLCNI